MRSRIIPVFLSVLLFLSSSCAIGYIQYGNTFFQPTSKKNVITDEALTQLHVFEDIHYGQHKNQTFDLNLPVDSKEETGLLLFLHGGGWIKGDKSAARRSYSVHKANNNYATASINYRFINDGESDINDIIDDITTAIRQIKALASSYSVNITKVALCGRSAGGHLALLYAYKYKDISPVKPVGVFASSPVPDLSLDCFFTDNALGDENHMCNLMSQLCGTEITKKTRASKKAVLDEYSPINYVSDTTVPTLIIHGNGDRIAPFSGSLLLMEKLSEHSINHELIVCEKTGHKLKNNEDKKKYASELLQACVNEWFGIEDN